MLENAVLSRPNIVRETVDASAAYVVADPLSSWERLYDNGIFRKLCVLLLLAGAWQGYAAWLDNPLLIPTFRATVEALWTGIETGGLLFKAWYSIRVLLMGYATGIALAAVLTVLAICTRFGTDLLELLSAMFNPLPAIALLPLALVWFGLGYASLVFVLVHSVLWAVALNTHAGFLSVSPTMRTVGRNYGLKGVSQAKILIPAAFSNILTGLKIAWAFAWRTLIAAELMFGVSSGSGGLGWFIQENKNNLDIPSVFAGLFTVITIGLLVENLIFRFIEQQTV